MPTPNAGFTQPIINSYGWGTPTNSNWGIADSIFGGTRSIPNFWISGNLRVDGTITAGTFAGLDGSTFLTSALFNQPNGVPQLNAAGKIPVSLIPALSLITVPFSATPTFNAALGSGFSLTLTGDVSASTFINGASGAALIAIRIIQDSVGGRVFAWPANVRNAGAVNKGANKRSQQLFMSNPDGSLDGVGTMSYS